jgi:hypothetical protein
MSACQRKAESGQVQKAVPSGAHPSLDHSWTRLWQLHLHTVRNKYIIVKRNSSHVAVGSVSLPTPPPPHHFPQFACTGTQSVTPAPSRPEKLPLLLLLLLFCPCIRVDAVQQALVSVTGIGVSDQIVMCHGARLDPAKPLAAYKLPLVSRGP